MRGHSNAIACCDQQSKAIPSGPSTTLRHRHGRVSSSQIGRWQMASAPVLSFIQLSSPLGFEPAGVSPEGGVCGSISVTCHDPVSAAVASTACSPLPVSHIFSLTARRAGPSAARVSAAIVTVPWSSLAGLRQVRSAPGGLARKSLKLSPLGGPSACPDCRAWRSRCPGRRRSALRRRSKGQKRRRPRRSGHRPPHRRRNPLAAAAKSRCVLHRRQPTMARPNSTGKAMRQPRRKQRTGDRGPKRSQRRQHPGSPLDDPCARLGISCGLRSVPRGDHSRSPPVFQVRECGSGCTIFRLQLYSSV